MLGWQSLSWHNDSSSTTLSGPGGPAVSRTNYGRVPLHWGYCCVAVFRVLLCFVHMILLLCCAAAVHCTPPVQQTAAVLHQCWMSSLYSSRVGIIQYDTRALQPGVVTQEEKVNKQAVYCGIKVDRVTYIHTNEEQVNERSVLQNYSKPCHTFSHTGGASQRTTYRGITVNRVTYAHTQEEQVNQQAVYCGFTVNHVTYIYDYTP